jgi:hypothetical protein
MNKPLDDSDVSDEGMGQFYVTDGTIVAADDRPLSSVLSSLSKLSIE